MMRATLRDIWAFVHPVALRVTGILILILGMSGLDDSVTEACEADSVLNLFEISLPMDKVTKIKYHKEARSLLFGERPAEAGTLWLGPPNRYRIETGRQTIVRGTDTLWSYTPETKQVTLRIGGLDSLEFGPAGFRHCAVSALR